MVVLLTHFALIVCELQTLLAKGTINIAWNSGFVILFALHSAQFIYLNYVECHVEISSGINSSEIYNRHV